MQNYADRMVVKRKPEKLEKLEKVKSPENHKKGKQLKIEK